MSPYGIEILFYLYSSKTIIKSMVSLDANCIILCTPRVLVESRCSALYRSIFIIRRYHLEVFLRH